MVEALDIPVYREMLKRWTVSEYEQLSEIPGLRRMELIRGVLIENMPKSPLHRALTKWIYDYLLPRMPAGMTVFMEAPLRLQDSEPEPDVMIVAGAVRDFRDHHPTSAELVVEVAVTTPALDRENASLYAEAGVSEYWIVLAHDQAVEVYTNPENGVYLTKVVRLGTENLEITSLPGTCLSLAELFA